MKRRAVPVATLACLALLLITPVGAHGAAPAPADMVLQPADLPAGFGATVRRDRPNSAVAAETGVRLATLRAWGRRGGHEAIYDRRIDPATPPRGPASVVSVVSTYSSPTGLRRAFSASVQRVERDRAVRHVERRAPRGLGTGARMWETRFDQDGVPVILFTMLWRSRGTLSFLSVAGVGGRLDAAGAVALARRQQARIARATRGGGGPRLVAARLYTGERLGR